MKCPDCDIKTKITKTVKAEFYEDRTLECFRCGRRWKSTYDLTKNVVRIYPHYPKGLNVDGRRLWFTENNSQCEVFDLPKLK